MAIMIPEGTVISGVIGGFISKIINDSVDVSKTSIKKVIESKITKNENMQSQIYQVIVNAFNEITYGKYQENQDIIYDATENLLKGLKNNKGDIIEAVKAGLAVFGETVYSESCEEFKILLYQELCTSDELYKEVSLLKQDQQIDGINSIKYGMDEVKQIVTEIKENETNKKISQNYTIHKKVKNKTQEYANKWNENMFLNNFNKRDKNNGKNIKLKDVYIEAHLPHYIWKDNNDKIWTDLKNLLLSEYINEQKDNKMLLILGQPGIGKSSLITWITANLKNLTDDILVYQFASDLNTIDWNNTSEKYNLAEEILMKFGLSDIDLNGKALILDGFDELSVRNREEILNKLFWQFIKEKSFSNFSIIITCRENYIQNLHRIQFDYITLQAWDEKQVKSFCKLYQDKTGSNISKDTISNIINNKEILGIPLILYMVLALNVFVEKEGSVVDVYDRIFSLEGGIYDRCIENRSFANAHRIGKIKNQIHQVSREIAMWIFENNPDGACISQKEYINICNMQENKMKSEVIDIDFKIGNYFKSVKHCEGLETEELYFVHRSIYEYFVAETIFSSIENAIMKLSENSQEELAGNIAFYLKKGKITYTIGEFLYSKLIKLYYKMNHEKKNRYYIWWENTIVMMLQYGMFFFTNRNIKDFKNIISEEVNCFFNMLDILRFLSHIRDNKYIIENANSQSVKSYIKYGIINCVKVNLSYLNLKLIDLQYVDLREADLQYTNLSEANLQYADLRGANLQYADLRGANLKGANLENVNLVYANLTGANLESANLHDAVLGNALSSQNINLQMVNLDNVNLSKNNLVGKNLQKASICFADLNGINLSDANLEGADLSESKLCNAILKNANLSKMDLIAANLNGANLQKANLYRASLNGANLINADLSDANLYEININDSIWTVQDIQKILPKLINAVFKFIVIESNNSEKRKIYRKQLFAEYAYISDM